MGAVKVYTSSITGRTEVRKRIQRVLFVLQSKRIDHEVIDLARSQHEELEFLKTHCKIDPEKPTGKAPGLPQIFSDDICCGGYEEFEEAVENEELYSFLKLKSKSVEKDSAALNGFSRKLKNGEAGDEQKNETENLENAGEVQEEATEEDADAAWERRLKAKKLKKLAADNVECLAEDDDQKATLSTDQCDDRPTDEGEGFQPQDDDAAWQRRMKKRKQQQQEEEEEQGVEIKVDSYETKVDSDQENVEPDQSGAGEDEIHEEEDAAWQRRMRRKKEEQLKKEQEEKLADEEEIIEDDDVEIEEN